MIVLIVLLGFAARFINLGGDSLWFDEILTFSRASQSIDALLLDSPIDQPPGFTIVEHGSMLVWGKSDYALRLPSALAGVLAIPLVYVVGSLIANRRVALWLAFLLAIAPFHIRYSQEARGYAIQVALAAASTVCMLLALKSEKKRYWAGFGVVTALNAYNLFGAFVVLISQLIFVGFLTIARTVLKLWTVRQALNVLLGVTIGLLVVGILYSPWIEPAIRGALANIGSDARQAVWLGVPINDWASNAYFAFGFNDAALAAVMGLLALTGAIHATVQRRLDQILWLGAGMLSPLLLIKFVGVARAPLPKYILFILPVYLLAVSIGLDAIVEATRRWAATRNRSLSRWVPVPVVTALILVGTPAIIAEHAFVERDWKGVVNSLKGMASEGDVIVPLTLDLPTGFNQGVPGLGHYLPQSFANIHLLIGEFMADSGNDLPTIAQSSGDVWFTLLNRNHVMQFDDPDIEVVPFQGAVYLVHSRSSTLPPLEEMVKLYQEIIPQASTPAPRCYLWLDLSVLQIELGRFDEAYESLSNFPGSCPGTLAARQQIFSLLLDHALDTDQTDQAHDLALQLLVLDTKDQRALEVLILFDFSEMFDAGRAVLVESPVLPIQHMRFTMPQDGDWGDVLLMQTPAQLTYQLALPDEPVELRSRIVMAPESWAWGGDGSTFIIQIETESGDRNILYEQHISNDESDQHWHDVRVALDEYAGQTISLTLLTDPGPGGDTTGDWAGWDSPRVVFSPIN